MVCADLDKVYSTHFIVKISAKNMQKQRMKEKMMYLQ